MRDDAVVITGAALITALGRSPRETWDALISGETGVKAIEGFEVRGFDCRLAAQVRGLDAGGLKVLPRSARIMDLHSFLLLECACAALEQARLDRPSVPSEEIGFFVGMGMVDYKVEDFLPAVVASSGERGELDMGKFYAKGYHQIYPLMTLSMLNNISVCQAAIHLNIRGENAVFAPQADSGAQAITEGRRAIVNGKARAVLAGGVSEKVSPESLARSHIQGVLSAGGSASESSCRPFATDRNGTVLGEGCGILCLESRRPADERGVPYNTMITGSGASFDTEQQSTAPSADAIGRAMMAALKNADVTPEQIDVVIGHGDGTCAGDGNEIDAIGETFARCLNRPVVFSSKQALGHLMAAAPVVDAILGMAILETGLVPPTLRSAPPDGSIALSTCDRPVKTAARRVMINCRSYEGQCASLILERVA
jgi:3-oxoacyl-[acyl-carrier-protein] synthase II